MIPTRPFAYGLLLAMAASFAAAIPQAWAIDWLPKGKAKEPPPVVQVNPPPPVMQNTLPVADPRMSQPSTSIDSAMNTPIDTQGYVKFTPYNTYPHELNLWGLEKYHFIRSDAIIAPDKDLFVYTETVFVAPHRQTKGRLFLVPVDTLPPANMEQLPSEQVQAPPPPPPEADFDRFDPNKTLRTRQSLVDVGYEKLKPYDFKTLTVIDWSVTGQRLLFKQRSGVLHVGVRTSDIIVYDRQRGTITIYPEVQRAVKNYWMNTGNLPNMDKLSWEMQPLGWENGSDTAVLLKGWAYDKREKKFLGIWRYDVDSERMEMLSKDDQPVPVAANGFTATFSPPPPPKGGVFSYQTDKPGTISGGTSKAQKEKPSGTNTGKPGQQSSSFHSMWEERDGGSLKRPLRQLRAASTG